MVNGLAPTFEFHPSIVRTASSNSSQSIGRGSAGARCAGSVVIGSAVHVPLILARHKDKSPDFRPILADTFRETQAISRIAINRPLDESHALLVPNSHTFIDAQFSCRELKRFVRIALD